MHENGERDVRPTCRWFSAETMNLWMPFATVTKNAFDDTRRTPMIAEPRPPSTSRRVLIRKLLGRLISPNLFSLNERYERVARVMHGETKCLTPRKWYSAKMANVCVGAMLTSFYCSNKMKGSAKANLSASPSRTLTFIVSFRSSWSARFLAREDIS